MAVLSKEIQTRTTRYNIQFFYSLLFRLRTFITNKLSNVTNKSFKKILIFLYKIMKRLLSVSKWLLAPKYITTVAIRHGLLLFLLSTIPIIFSVFITPLRKWFRKKYLIYKMGANWVYKYDKVNNYLKNEAKTYKQWKIASNDLDEMENCFEWIMTDKSKYYNYKKLIADTDQLQKYLSLCRRYDERQKNIETKNNSFQ